MYFINASFAADILATALLNNGRHSRSCCSLAVPSHLAVKDDHKVCVLLLEFAEDGFEDILVGMAYLDSGLHFLDLLLLSLRWQDRIRLTTMSP